MTGYGRADEQNEQLVLSVEIRSVNSRFLDFSPRIPKLLQRFEDDAYKMVKQICERGRVSLSVKIDYINQLKHPSNLIIGQKVARLGTKSYDIQSAVFEEKSELLICCSTITSVCYDFTNNRSVPIYKEIIDDYNK